MCGDLVEVRDVVAVSPPGAQSQARRVARTGPGRGLFLTEDVKGGDTILVDDPVLIYPDEGNKRVTCASCFGMPHGTAVDLPCRCDTCKEAWFCCKECHEAALKATPGQGHSPQECALLQKMSSMRNKLGGEGGITLSRMLIKAALIKAHDTDRWRQLQDLCAPDGLEDHDCDWGMLCLRITDLGADLASLGGAQARLMLQRDASNGMGILAKKGPDEPPSLRAGCLYGTCSMINHACSPNVARFDYFDDPGTGNMQVHVRALSDLQAGTELRMNYLSILVGVKERQERLLDEYGFKCECDRCYLEMLFPDDESPSSDEDASEAQSKRKVSPVVRRAAPTEEEEDRRNALALWIAKYSCPEEDCGGTMVPTEASNEQKGKNGSASKRRKTGDGSAAAAEQQWQDGADIVMECNRCCQIIRGMDRVYELLE